MSGGAFTGISAYSSAARGDSTRTSMLRAVVRDAVAQAGALDLGAERHAVAVPRTTDLAQRAAERDRVRRAAHGHVEGRAVATHVRPAVSSRVPSARSTTTTKSSPMRIS